MTYNISETSHFSVMKKLWDLNKGFSNLELEGHGRGIIMGMTRLLLLGLFYTIQTKRDQTFWRGVYLFSCKEEFLKIFSDSHFCPHLLLKYYFMARTSRKDLTLKHLNVHFILGHGHLSYAHLLQFLFPLLLS